MTWSVYFYETTSGQLSRQIESADFSWRCPVNAAASGSITIDKQHLRGLHSRQVRPWIGGILICRVTPDGFEEPWTGGPITAPPKETERQLTLNWSDPFELFKHRVISETIEFESLTWGEIIWRLVQHAMLRPGGQLPIVHGTPPETGDVDVRYEGWNLANNQVADVIEKISNLENGPDFVLRPRWVDPGVRVEWELVHGVKSQPTIPQEWVPEWDITVSESDVQDWEISSKADTLASRVWGTGAGQGEGTVIGKVENLWRVERGYPFMEHVVSFQDESTVGRVTNLARGHLRQVQAPTDQLSLKVSAASEKNQLGRWRTGDAAYVTLPNGSINIPAGRHIMRIISASGDSGESVNLEMQEDQWGE